METQAGGWRKEMRDAVRGPGAGPDGFPMLVPAALWALAGEGETDPIRLQFAADPREDAAQPAGYSDDPVLDRDAAYQQAPGLVRKYGDRALLVVTGACAVHCRYCFRRTYPYGELPDGGPGLRAARDLIAADPAVREVILSGGDPLTLSDAALAELLDGIEAIPHVRRLRLHSRMPIVLPSRVTPALIDRLARSRLRAYVIVHANHPRELTDDALAACARFRLAGIPVLNQSVLLRGVNDDVDVQVALCQQLADEGIRPYYLHQLDRVRGAAHFEVDDERARAIHRGMRARLSGIALPALVRDVPGALSKVALMLVVATTLGFGCRRDRETAVVPLVEPPASVVEDDVITPPPPPLADRVLTADLYGDGPVVFVASGNEVRFGRWADGAPGPELSGRHRGGGAIQEWLAADLDGDGADEVVIAFGLGRGFAQAKLEVALIRASGPGMTIGRTIWSRNGERNQVTALAPWPRGDGTFDLYVSAFSSRFDVQGGVLSRDGGEPVWLDGHTLRMGMARAVGDWDGDGKTDVAVGRLYGDDVDSDGDLRVLFPDGRVESVPTVRGVRAVASCDVDGDRRPELLFSDMWHKRYAEQARFHPSVASRGPGGWSVMVLDERAKPYAVERFSCAPGRIAAGGAGGAFVYARGGDGVFRADATPRNAAASGDLAWAGDALIVSGPKPTRSFVPRP